MALKPLTPMEHRLKTYYMMRPDIQKRILTYQELSDYLVWMAQTEAARNAGTVPIDNPAFAKVAASIRRNSSDQKVIRSFISASSVQKEDRFVHAGNDLARGQMFRYMPAHWNTNEYFEIYYCFSGHCPIHLDNEVLTLTHGSVLILAPNVRHASPCYADDALLQYYMLRSSTFDRVFWNQLPSDSLMSVFFHKALSHTKHPSYLHFETSGDEDLENLLNRIDREYTFPETYSAQYLNLLMSEFFLLLLRRHEGTARLPRTGSFFWKHEFSAIFSYIQSHFAECTLADIGKEFGYSERQLNRIVKNCTGETYAHLSLRLKMEKAALLLSKGSEINACQEACGYATLSSFYRAFTEYHGCTPAEYKKRAVADGEQL